MYDNQNNYASVYQSARWQLELVHLASGLIDAKVNSAWHFESFSVHRLSQDCQ